MKVTLSFYVPCAWFLGIIEDGTKNITTYIWNSVYLWPILMLSGILCMIGIDSCLKGKNRHFSYGRWSNYEIKHFEDEISLNRSFNISTWNLKYRNPRRRWFRINSLFSKELGFQDLNFLIIIETLLNYLCNYT